MDYLYIVSLFIFTTVFRSIIRIYFPKLIDYDTYYHIYMIDFIRKNGTADMVEYKRFIKPFSLNYPWMTHWILSIFPKRFDSLLERFFNPFLDSLFVVILYLVTFYMTNSDEKSLMLCLLYIFTPATFSILGTGPRIKSFTPRLFGEIIGSLVFIFEYLYLESGDLFFLGLAIFFASLVYLASKFAVQALVLINIPLILVTHSYELVSVVFFGFMLAMIYSRGGYWKILKQQIVHLKYYFMENLKGHMAVSDRNNFSILFDKLRKLELKEILRILLVKNSYFILLYKTPIIIVFVYLIFLDIKLLNDGIFIFSALFIFFLTSLRWFLFIGEAERYINYILFFILLFLIDNNIDQKVYIFLILYGVIYYILDFLIVFKKYNNKIIDDDLLIEWLNKQKGSLNIGTINYGLGGWRIVSDTNHNRLYGMLYINTKDRDKLRSFQTKHPFLDIEKVEEIIDYYELDYFILNKKHMPSDLLNSIQISENLFAIYKENI
jgi:hypothetical protein